MLSRIAAVAGTVWIAGCAGATMDLAGPNGSPAEVRVLAVAPGSGALGDAIAMRLFDAGFTIVSADDVTAMLWSSGVQSFEIGTTPGLAALRAKGVDALLIVKSVVGNDGRPESASVRVSATGTGALLAGVAWSNGWGGREGSLVDRGMRDNMSESAGEIASGLCQRIQPAKDAGLTTKAPQ